MTTNRPTNYKIQPSIFYGALVAFSKSQLSEDNGKYHLPSTIKSLPQMAKYRKYRYFLRTYAQSFQNEDWDKLQKGEIEDPDFARYSIPNPLIITPLNLCDYTYFIGCCRYCGLCMELKLIVANGITIRFSHSVAPKESKVKCPRVGSKLNAEEFIIMNYDTWRGKGIYVSKTEIDDLLKNKTKISFKNDSNKNIKKRIKTDDDCIESKSNNNIDSNNDKPMGPPTKKQKLDSSGSKIKLVHKKTESLSDCDSVYSEYTAEDENVSTFLHGLRFIGSIDRGRFGRIYSAYNVVDECILAVKVTSKQRCAQTNTDRVEIELEIFKQLKNDQNIVKFVKNVLINNAHHIFLEFMHYNLEIFLKMMTSMTDDDRRNTFEITMISIGGAIYSIHKIGFTHCDIKPKNILLNFDTHSIKLTDFGSAIKDGEFPLNITPGYYPEHERADSHIIDKDFNKSAVDIFCYGMTLFAILYPDQSPSAFMEEIDKEKDAVVKSERIIGKQTKLYVSCRQSSFTQRWCNPMALIEKCLHPQHSERIDLDGIMELNYFKQCKSKTLTLPLPSQFKPLDIPQIISNINQYPQYLSGIKNTNS